MSTPTTIKSRPGAVTPVVKAIIASPGPQGPQGPTGPTGAQGALGPQGPIGNTGSQGPQGVQGVAGPDGPQGIQGVKGDNISDISDNGNGTLTILYGSGLTLVTSDLSGSQGPAGATGAQGSQGVQGPAGPQGSAGTNGAQGIQGPSGTSVVLKGSVETEANLPTVGNITGDLFVVLDTSDAYVWTGSAWEDVGPIQGPAGAQGIQGPAGATGAQGIQGPAGATGAQGSQGVQGVAGPQGSVGATGQTGAQGIQGEIGKSAFDEAVELGFAGTEQQFLTSLVGPQGSQGVQGDVGPQGAQGQTGNSGPQGQPGADGGTNIIVDETPQLGGDLDVNGKKITSVANGDIIIIPNGTGKTVVESNLEVVGQTKTTTLNIDDKSLYVTGLVVNISTSSPTLLYSTTKKCAKITVKLNSNNTEFQISEFLLVTDGTNPKGTEYAVLFTGASTLGAFTVVQNENTLEFFCQASISSTSATFTAFDLS